jgi:hypothetical protein
VTDAAPKVGNDAGWYLRFFTVDGTKETPKLTCDAGDYYADIQAVLPTGLEGGSYQFAIEGITNDDYQKLNDVWTHKTPLYVDLHLYWRDTSLGPAYLANLAGLSSLNDSAASSSGNDSLVARLIVSELKRRVGARRYEAFIQARESVYDALTRRLSRSMDGSDLVDLAQRIAHKELGVEAKGYAPAQAAPAAGSASDSKAPKTAFPNGTRGVDALETIGRAMAQQGRAGRSTYLIRNGTLHIGVDRPIPFSGKPTELDDGSGLIHVGSSGASESEPTEVSSSGDKRDTRLQYELVLKGRPDIKPGDVVRVRDPLTGAVDSSAPAEVEPPVLSVLRSLGSSAAGEDGTKIDVYVSSVRHRLSRSEGFVTTLAGVQISDGHEWDDGNALRGDPSASAHGDIAGTIKDMVDAAALEPLAVGEVRAAHSSGQGEPPSQTLDVWMGLQPGDGKAYRARRLKIDRDAKSRVSGIPYATPFAWGKCGLVLPRYPGTRVVVGHRDGRTDDPIELGALWESGHGPDSQAGDWWLILPADTDRDERQSAEDDAEPNEPSGKASNDLIDADGNRVIEVGKLTVRILPTKLKQPGQRPAPGDDHEQVAIEHESGSRIVIMDNGNVIIHSEGDMTLSAKKNITLDASSATDGSVVVKTGGTKGKMDVS